MLNPVYFARKKYIDLQSFLQSIATKDFVQLIRDNAFVNR